MLRPRLACWERYKELHSQCLNPSFLISMAQRWNQNRPIGLCCPSDELQTCNTRGRSNGNQ
ncbi:hypothetical protein Godav_019958 [Gossypium davidsonii]|uniref:Uncharacterized protein n=2 Tax=Gossypium TaxID=3633 RepID=A0A7J8R2B9_GOSDV|nr:hypothetical protein [Gossypium davidsonii]MBA0642674.1 hypothetical protein [Gossypium klotzschianum]